MVTTTESPQESPTLAETGFFRDFCWNKDRSYQDALLAALSGIKLTNSASGEIRRSPPGALPTLDTAGAGGRPWSPSHVNS